MNADAGRPWSNARLAAVAVSAHLLLAACAWHYALVVGIDASTYGSLGEAAGLVAFTVLAGIAWLHGVRQAPSLDRRFVLGLGIALAVLQAAAPPFVSHDLWDYLARGRLEVLGHNPFTTTVLQWQDDPRLAAFTQRAAWPHAPMPYGALMAALQWLCALPDSPWVGCFLWKGATVLAHVATALVVERTIADRGDAGAARTGLVLWLWHPWILLECCGSGHNEVFLVLLLALLCRCLARDRFGLGSAAYGFAMLVKHCCPPLAPLLLVLAVRRRRVPALLLGSVPVAIAIAVAWWHYWNVPGGFAWLKDQSDSAINSLCALSAHFLFHRAGTAVRALGALAVLAVFAVSLRRVADARTFARAAALAMVAFVFAFAATFQPWYQLWWLPLFALAEAPVLVRALRLLAFAGPLAYLAEVAIGFGTTHQIWLFCCASALPALTVLHRWRELLPPRIPRP